MKHIKLISAIFLAIMLVACDGFSFVATTYNTDVKGSVLNAMSRGDTISYWLSGSDSLEGAEIKAYPVKSDGTYLTSSDGSAKVNRRGEFNFFQLKSGRYKLVGKKAGWVFVPAYVDINGNSITLPPISAFKEVSSDTLVILLEWENNRIDLDGILTYYDGWSRDYVGYITTNNSAAPELSTSGYKYKSKTGDITLVRDITKDTDEKLPRIETIVINWDSNANFVNKNGNSLGDVPNNVLSYYINAFEGSVTGVDEGYNSKSFSNAKVHIMYGNSHYGTFTAPINTDQKTIHVLDIEVNESNYTIPRSKSSIIRSLKLNNDFVKIH
jgi:hypothetical protein